MSGTVSYHSGLQAEEVAVQHYLQQGYHLLERRWRSAAGEIDIIFRKGSAIVFVEVKKSRSFSRALLSLSNRQAERIFSSAEIFLGRFATQLDTEARIDVAAVNHLGEIQVLENAISH